MNSNIISITLNVEGSKVIEQITYSLELQNLIVKFVTGSDWLYKNVPSNIFAGFLNTPSLGSYFASEIKGKFEGVKLV